MLFFQSIFCSNKLTWIKIFNSIQSIFVCWADIGKDQMVYIFPTNKNGFKKIKSLNSAMTTRIHFYPIKI